MSSTKSAATPSHAESLKTRLESATVLTPDSTGYSESLKRWSDAAEKPAGIVVLPSTATDISVAICFAQEHNLDLAVRGGGHSVAGTSSSDGGLVIDLSRMREVKIDVENKTIIAQGGCLWVDVDLAAAQHGLATVGGAVNHTGVGGLTLGGYGWLSPRYGMVVDNLISATVVLADGQIVTASADENPDLFWALRGAGHNFGVVAEFSYRAHEQPNEVFGGLLSFTPDKLEAVMGVLNSTLEHPDMNCAAVCAFAQPPGAPGPMVNVLVFYNGPEEPGRERFAELFALQPVVNLTSMMPYNKMNSLSNPMAPHGGRKTFKGVFYTAPLRPVFARTIFDTFAQKLQADPGLGTSALFIEYFDMRKICEVSLTSTAFSNRGFTQNGVIFLNWTDPAKDAEYREWARQLQQMWTEEQGKQAKERNIMSDEVPQYINYAEPGDLAVPQIFGANTARLQKLKAKYDPNCVFKKMNPITPVP